MTIAEVMLFKGDRPRPRYFGRLSLEPLLREALDEADEDITFVLVFHQVGEDAPVEDRLVNLLPDFGELDVLAVRGKQVVYRRKFGVGALLGPVLRRFVDRIDADEPHWSFRISHPVLDGERSYRKAPSIEGAVDVNLHRPNNQPLFTINKVEEPAVAEVRPADHGMPEEYLTPINVLMTPATQSLLLSDLPLSQRIEEGGFFLGTVRAIAGGDTRYLVEITAVTPAQSSGAGKGHFTFTADSFAAVNQLRAERGQGEELVGWYHTHLFEAGTGLGLSDVDLDLHFATFRRPWQVAGLLNVTKHRRVLRFYGRQDNDMRACTQWIRHERDRYLPAGVGVDDE